MVGLSTKRRMASVTPTPPVEANWRATALPPAVTEKALVGGRPVPTWLTASSNSSVMILPSALTVADLRVGGVVSGSSSFNATVLPAVQLRPALFQTLRDSAVPSTEASASWKANTMPATSKVRFRAVPVRVGPISSERFPAELSWTCLIV